MRLLLKDAPEFIQSSVAFKSECTHELVIFILVITMRKNKRGETFKSQFLVLEIIFSSADRTEIKFRSWLFCFNPQSISDANDMPCKENLSHVSSTDFLVESSELILKSDDVEDITIPWFKNQFSSNALRLWSVNVKIGGSAGVE